MRVPPTPYSTRRRRRLSDAGWIAAASAAAVAVIVFVVLAVVVTKAYSKHHMVTTTVQSKERVCSGSNSGCKYLVFTNHGTYRITDAFLIGTTRFNSSDVYGRIHACDKYRIEYYGWRLPYFSSYPNIVKADDIGVDKSCRP